VNVLIIITLVICVVDLIVQFLLFRLVYKIESIVLTHRRIIRILIEHSSDETKVDLKKMQQDVQDMRSPTITIN